MAKKSTEARRKLIEFDAQTWHALNLLRSAFRGSHHTNRRGSKLRGDERPSS
jgi:hypothetical protein